MRRQRGHILLFLGCAVLFSAGRTYVDLVYIVTHCMAPLSDTLDGFKASYDTLKTS